MTRIVWDEVGERVYEAGVDQGILFTERTNGVPWNGLTEIVENYNIQSSPVYFEGMMVHDAVHSEGFSATMRAITYPEELDRFQGLEEFLNEGVSVYDQAIERFGLCYRTKVGNDLEGSDFGYKIHLLYNVQAIPSNRTYRSLSNQEEPTEFQWEINAIPHQIAGHRPSAHISFDSRTFPYMDDLEEMIYGGEFSNAKLLEPDEFPDFIDLWAPPVPIEF